MEVTAAFPISSGFTVNTLSRTLSALYTTSESSSLLTFTRSNTPATTATISPCASFSTA